MIFNDTKYTRYYYDIISSAQKGQRSGHTETHHIIPRALGGDDEDCNLVKLTPREHYLCHALLVHMVCEPKHIRSMYAAFNMMHVDRHGKRYTSKLYEYYKIKFYKLHAEQQRGRKRTLESRQKQSNTTKGRGWTDKKKASAWVGPTAKPVIATSYKTGEYVGTYESISQAAKQLGCDTTTIWKMCEGKEGNAAPNGNRYPIRSHKGYTFHYLTVVS